MIRPLRRAAEVLHPLGNVCFPPAACVITRVIVRQQYPRKMDQNTTLVFQHIPPKPCNYVCHPHVTFH